MANRTESTLQFFLGTVGGLFTLHAGEDNALPSQETEHLNLPQRGTLQNAVRPFTFRCNSCERSWCNASGTWLVAEPQILKGRSHAAALHPPSHTRAGLHNHRKISFEFLQDNLSFSATYSYLQLTVLHLKMHPSSSQTLGVSCSS